MVRNEATHLDLFSTSPTTALQERKALSSPCIYNAPYFAYQIEGKKWRITQGNCHHWDCPRCGLGRAKQEYGRMVQGCRMLGENYPLYFITITCKGKELSHEEAEKRYGEWTNRLLDACRARAKRQGGQWHYVQVTERQKRLHPHSHFITTFCPPVSSTKVVRKSKVTESGQRKIIISTHLRSDWFADRLCSSGLGEQYDITRVETVEGASRYVAKYLFKASIFESDWPTGWKRIRYSQTFPNTPKTATDAIVLLSHADWVALTFKAVIVEVNTLDDYEEAKRHYWYTDLIVQLRTKV